MRILSPFYYRGFIKIYAEFLGLDVAEIYKQYNLNQTPLPTSSATVAVKSKRRETRPNVSLSHSKEGIAFSFKPKTFQLILKIIGFLLLLLLLFKAAGCVASHMNKKGVYSKKQSSFSAPENKIKIHQSTNRESVQAPSVSNKVEVAVRATRDLWLRVKADDKVVFETTLSKGSLENWSADNRIELSGRNLELLDMEVNNKQIGFLGGGDRRIRKVLITHDGLTVKK